MFQPRRLLLVWLDWKTAISSTVVRTNRTFHTTGWYFQSRPYRWDQEEDLWGLAAPVCPATTPSHRLTALNTHSADSCTESPVSPSEEHVGHRAAINTHPASFSYQTNKTGIMLLTVTGQAAKSNEANWKFDVRLYKGTLSLENSIQENVLQFMSCYLMNISDLFSLRKLLEISLVGFRVEKSFFRAVLSQTCFFSRGPRIQRQTFTFNMNTSDYLLRFSSAYNKGSCVPVSNMPVLSSIQK